MFYVRELSRERVKLWRSRMQHKQIDLINEDCIDARIMTCLGYGPNLVHIV